MKCQNFRFQNNLIYQNTLNKTHQNKNAQFKQSFKHEYLVSKLKSTEEKTQMSIKDGRNYIKAGPVEKSEIDLEQYDNKIHNKILMNLFKNKLIEALDGEKSQKQGFEEIVDLALKLNKNDKYTPEETTEKSIQVLKSLFPSWLPQAFKKMFSEPFPEFACKLNAWATSVSCEWLMGPCQINNIDINDSKIGIGHGVFVERCRFLESAGCASVCLNSCKKPTQEFFKNEMGLPVTLTPNYDDFSCQFSFGLTPPDEMDDDAFKTPCFQQCPSKKKYTDACINS